MFGNFCEWANKCFYYIAIREQICCPMRKEVSTQWKLVSGIVALSLVCGGF